MTRNQFASPAGSNRSCQDDVKGYRTDDGGTRPEVRSPLNAVATDGLISNDPLRPPPGHNSTDLRIASAGHNAVANAGMNSMRDLRPPAPGQKTCELHGTSAGRTFFLFMLVRAVAPTIVMMVIALLAIIMAITQAAGQERIACKPNYQGDGITYWAWRTIDGRTCWYQGERRIDKSRLYWPPQGSSQTPAGVPEEPSESDGPVEPRPPQALSAEDQALLESYWPDLSTLPVLFPVERWWPYDHLAAMLDFAHPFEPPGAERFQINLVVLLAGAMFAACGTWVALEFRRTSDAHLGRLTRRETLDEYGKTGTSFA